jgi:hypothetical protein
MRFFSRFGCKTRFFLDALIGSIGTNYFRGTIRQIGSATGEIVHANPTRERGMLAETGRDIAGPVPGASG